MKTVIYLRVSSEMQSKFGFSMENQLERCQAYCAYNNLSNIVILKDEGISGKTIEKRPAIMQLYQMIKNKELSNVVCYSISRIGRKAIDTLNFYELLTKNNIILHSISEHAESITAYGRKNLRDIASQAQFEVELLGERVASVLQHKKSKKQVYSKHLTGFDNQDGLLVPNEHIKTVELILKLKQQGKTDYSIAKELNEQGLKTIHNSPFKPISITRIANNPVYSAT